jgi:hypothetical protein
MAMEPAIRELIEKLHRAPYQYALALTGGGAGAAAWLLSVPGASRAVLEINVPYQEQALTEFLGLRPEQFCSAATARALAARAYERARWLAPGQRVFGAGCTASLVTDRSKQGDHRFHVAVQAAEQGTTFSLTLRKGARDREEEEALVDAVVLNALAAACGVPERLELALLSEEILRTETQSGQGLLERFFRDELPAVCLETDGHASCGPARPPVLLPGAFNPVHAGHWGLAATAARVFGAPVAFELSLANVDKPALSAEEARWRSEQFRWRAAVWLTRAPTFVEKAALFPGTVFVVGADTAARLLEPRYYQESEARLAEAFGQFRQAGCRFLVAGRADAAGRFLGVEGLGVPTAHRDLFVGIPETEFRLDLSSTRLRAEETRW